MHAFRRTNPMRRCPDLTGTAIRNSIHQIHPFVTPRRSFPSSTLKLTRFPWVSRSSSLSSKSDLRSPCFLYAPIKKPPLSPQETSLSFSAISLSYQLRNVLSRCLTALSKLSLRPALQKPSQTLLGNKPPCGWTTYSSSCFTASLCACVWPLATGHPPAAPR